MIEAVVAGCALGGVYALASCGLVVTYLSSGILNFAFAALAFFIARLYYFLHIQHGWGIAPAALVSIVAAGPALGALLWFLLFRTLRLTSQTVKIVVTIGLSVCVAPIAVLLFGNQPIVNAPGLAPLPERVFQVAGTAVTLDQLIVYACVAVFVVGGAAVLRWSGAGLLVRAVVDSEAMALLAGIRSQIVALSVWAVSIFLAGLAGVLAAPLIGLDAGAFTVIIAASFAAVIAARLQSVGIAVLVSLLMGIATALAERYLPPTSQFTADVIPSIPFAFIFIYLLYAAIRGARTPVQKSMSGLLDRAIAPHGGSEAELARAQESQMPAGRQSRLVPVAAVVLVALLPLLLRGIWVGMVALGLAYATVFLSYTLVVGEAGIIWLCVPTFAGIGAFSTAELATRFGWPVLAAMVVGGLVCACVGTILGFATFRLGDLYVALVTLTFGLLIENLVFGLNSLSNFGAGVAVQPPLFASTDRVLTWLFLGFFGIFAAIAANLRRSTFGFAVAAVRWSEPAARTIGLSVIATKVGISALGAAIAGFGGGMLAMYFQAAEPSAFGTFAGLTWLAVLVTVGSRANSAALIAGLAFSFIPEVVSAYLPASWGEVPPALFGLGAILVARNPEGTVAMHARQLERLISRRRHPSSEGEVGQPGGQCGRPGVTTQGAIAPVLSGEGITVRFGGVTALADVDIEIPPREIVGLVGPNGAGKTTLLGVLSGLIVPSTGRVVLGGTDVTSKSPQYRARRGLARTFQQPELFAGLSVREHLVLVWRLRYERGRLWRDLVDFRGRAGRAAKRTSGWTFSLRTWVWPTSGGLRSPDCRWVTAARGGGPSPGGIAPGRASRRAAVGTERP